LERRTTHLSGSLAEVAGALAELEEETLGRRDVESSRIYIRTGEKRGYYVASTLLAFEREVRRTSAEMSKGTVTLESALRAQYQESRDASEERQKKKSIYPSGPRVASLDLLSARQGSSVLELQPVGEIVDFLTSVPLTVMLNSVGLYGCAKTVRAWVNKHVDPIVTGSLVDAVAAAGDLGPAAFIQDEPDFEVEIPEVRTGLHLGELTVYGPAEVHHTTLDTDGKLTVITVNLHG
jgi:hypothetical protein